MNIEIRWLFSVCLATSLLGSGFAEESCDNKEQQIERKEKALSVFKHDLSAESSSDKEGEHIPVGTRAISQAERIEIEEERIDEEKAYMKEGLDESLKPRKTYYTSHNGAFHRPIAVTMLGDQVTLEDGSTWNVKWDHRYKTLDWLASDNILILPNHAWFSSYHYRLVNQNTGADAEVNLFLGPLYNGIYTRWIIAIDYLNYEVCLDDGSIWRLKGSDYNSFKKWLVNDTIIIGLDDTWFSSHPNILLNVNILNHSAATCENGF